MIVVFRLGVLLVLLSVGAHAQIFSHYEDPSLCTKNGFSMVLRSDDGPVFYGYSQQDLSFLPPIIRFQRMATSVTCDTMRGEGATFPSDRTLFAQQVLRNDTLTVATREGTFRSAAWGPWQRVDLSMPNREMVITSVAPLPDGRLLAAAQSYVVVRRDTSAGIIMSLIDSSRVHLGHISGLSFIEQPSTITDSTIDFGMTGATLPNGTTYFGCYHFKNAPTYLYEVTKDASATPISSPAGLPADLQSPVVVRVGDHTVYTFYGPVYGDRELSPPCYVRFDTRTRESSLHFVPGSVPQGGWSGDSVALVMCSGGVWVVRENNVTFYNVLDQIQNLSSAPTFYSAHRISTTEWLLSSNSGVYFFTFDATTSVDDVDQSVQSNRIATTLRTIDLSDRDPDPASVQWEVIDAIGHTCATGTGPHVSIPPSSGLYVVRFRNAQVVVMAL